MTKRERELAIRIGGNVKVAREQAGLTQVALAEACEIAQPHITRLEKGTHLPSLGTLDRVAEALGVNLCELVGDGPKKPAKGKKK